jgi:hypothetical protein
MIEPTRSSNNSGDAVLGGRLTDRYGAEVLAAGFTATPNLLLLHAARLGISTGELLLVQYVFQHWRDGRKPCPSVAVLAHEMGKSERMVRYYLNSLQKKGLLALEQQFDEEGGQRSNRFDFGPLLRAVEAVERANIARGGADRRSNQLGNQLQPVGEADCSPPLQSIADTIENHQYVEKDSFGFDPLQLTNAALKKAVFPDTTPVQVEATAGTDYTTHDAVAGHGRSVTQDPSFLALSGPVTVLGREFGDEAHPRVSTRRAFNLFLGSRLPMATFLTLLHAAAECTRTSRSFVTTYRSGDASRRKNLVPFWFATLERLVAEHGETCRSVGRFGMQENPNGHTALQPSRSNPSYFAQPNATADRAETDSGDPLWDRILRELATVVTPNVFATWLAPTRSLGMEGRTLRIEVPSAFHRQWIESRMSRQIDSTLELLDNEAMAVIFIEQPDE